MAISVNAENLTHCNKISHGFFTRKGGVSEGIYKGLNVGRGSADDQKKVSENRARVRKTLKADALCSLYQIHSADVVEVTMPWVPSELPKADAMVTNREGIALGILTADCVPVLFCDAGAGVIGAAHAGWKGAFGGVVQNTVAAMQKLGAEPAHIVTAIGPAIEQNSYQVDSLFYANFKDKDEASTAFFERDADSASHYFFNLKGYVRLQCQRAGLSNIEMLQNDTYGEEDAFYSYRRSCHRNEPDYGRQVSAIILNS